jgi:ribonuclease R
MSTPFPGIEGVLQQKVLDLLDQAGKKGLAPDQVRRELDVDVTDEQVHEVLAQLERQGKALEGQGRRWFALWVTDAAGWAVGRVSVLDSGDFIVRVGRPGPDQPGLFVPRREGKKAMDGDLVLVRPRGGNRKARPWDGKYPHGVILKVLSERHATVVGALETGQGGRRWLAPFDPKSNLELEVYDADDVPDGHYVVVAVDRKSSEDEASRFKPVGRVVEVLGDPDVPGVDVLVVLRHYQIPEEFPDEIQEIADALPPDPEPADWEGREDLRDEVIFTIDGASARDFDDAVSIERLPGGGYRLGVHIADVAHYVRDAEPLDVEAYRRSTSVYYPDRAVPMLPEGLSNGLCSLRPHVPRLTMSVFLDIAPDGQVRARRFAETVIRSARRMTYTEVRRLLLEPKPGDHKKYGKVLTSLREMYDLMRILNLVRVKRGSIDFDLPEGDVELDTDGYVVGVLASERNIAHRLIEEFMIAANEAVAFELVSREVPALFRVHDAPSLQKLQELKELLDELGFQLKGDLQDLPPRALQKVLEDVAGHPEEPFVSSVVLRTMQRARYDPECRGHYALASRYYSHFTSPIRRYPDLIVHRQLKALLRGTVEEQDARTLLPERLPAMGQHTSMTERRAEQSERDLLQWKKVRFLKDRVGERFQGRITGVQQFGMFIQLLPYYVDGLLPIAKMLGDFYDYEPEGHRLVGQRTGKVFKLGDPVEVILSGVSLRHRGLDFELPDQPRPEQVDGPWWLRAMYEPPPPREAGKRHSPATQPRHTPKKGKRGRFGPKGKPGPKGTTRRRR